MRHFSLSEKFALARGMFALARWRPSGESVRPTALAWLQAAGQPERVIGLFWQSVIESALGESIDLVDIEAARKVCVDAFLAHREASDLLVPTVPLGDLFGGRLTRWLVARGVAIATGHGVTAIERDDRGAVAAVHAGGERLPCDAVILAVPWRAAARLVPDVVPPADDRLAGSPITAVHLWFDRDCIDLPHAVLVGRVSQWIFKPLDGPAGYCQVVISASRGLFEGDRDRLLDTVVREVRSAFPAARDARLLASKIVTDPTAVLSVRPGVDAVRPAAHTLVPNLFLAGDWTATGWPSTMEGAVRSGRLAAAAVAASLGVPCTGLTPDLPKGSFVRLAMGRTG
jgi:squalene-associated FAD-dependent desaturase